MADAPPLRYHSGQHFHSVDRQKEIWRSHIHRHPHSPLELATHDEASGAGLAAGHGHSHLESHPYGQLLEVRQHVDGRPPDVRFLDPVAKAAEYRQKSADFFGTPELRDGYRGLAADMEKLAAMVPAVARPLASRPRPSVPRTGGYSVGFLAKSQRNRTKNRR